MVLSDVAQNDILDRLAAEPALTAQQIGTKTCLMMAVVYLALEALVSKGLVAEEGDRPNSVYSLTEEGHKERAARLAS
jgi:DNA-binding PadR family transcriptional regulator